MNATAAWRSAKAHSTVWSWFAPVRQLCDVLERVALSATTPRPDEGRRDAAVEEVVAGTALVAWAPVAARWIDAGWRHSATRGACARLIAPLPRSGNGAVRATAAIAAVASITVLVLQRAASRPSSFTWIVPAIALTVSVLLLFMTARPDTH